MEAEREHNRIRSMAWAFYQVLGCFYGINGPPRIMNWFWDVAHGEERDTSELFPITAAERAKYEWNPNTLPPEELARRFHSTYELLAPEFGYETRKESAKPWAEVPEQNKRLMIAVCAELANSFGADLQKRLAEAEKALRAAQDELHFIKTGEAREPQKP